MGMFNTASAGRRSRGELARVAVGCLLLLATAAGAGSPLQNARAVFTSGKGHVAFLGGSITQMDGYRPLVMAYLEQQFPDTAFTFTDAGLSSTCSTTGAFRFRDQVLAEGPVDLLFVEFAVNDDQDAGLDGRASIRGMEGIVRALRLANPRADIVMIYFINPFILEELTAGRTPPTIAAHARVAEHYGVTVIPLAQTVTADIQADSYDWQRFGGTHPAPFGNRICADLIEQACRSAWDRTPAVEPVAHPMPDPLDPGSYYHGGFLAVDTLTLGDGWAWSEPEWETIPGNLRADYADRSLLHTSMPEAELQGSFSGTTLGAFLLAGPDSGTLEARIDDGPYRPVETHHRHSANLHYPRTLLLAEDLDPGRHRFSLRLTGQGAIRILHLVANSPPQPESRPALQ